MLFFLLTFRQASNSFNIFKSDFNNHNIKQKNLEFLRDTLCLNVEEKKAKSSFLKDFNHAITNAWTVSMNWNIHNMVRDNS